MSNTVRNLDMLVEFFSTTIFQYAPSQNLRISQGNQGVLTQREKALSTILKVTQTCRPLWKEVSKTQLSRSLKVRIMDESLKALFYLRGYCSSQ